MAGARELRAADAVLAECPYAGGFEPSAADRELLDAIFGGSSAVAEWAARVASYHPEERARIGGAGAPPQKAKPEKQQAQQQQQQQQQQKQPKPKVPPKPAPKAPAAPPGDDAPLELAVEAFCALCPAREPAPAGGSVWAAAGAAGSARLTLRDAMPVAAADAVRRALGPAGAGGGAAPGVCYVGDAGCAAQLRDGLGLLPDWEFREGGDVLPSPTYWSEAERSHVAVGNCPVSKEHGCTPPFSAAGHVCGTPAAPLLTPRCPYSGTILAPAAGDPVPIAPEAAAAAGALGFVPPTAAPLPPGVTAPLPILHPAAGRGFLYPAEAELTGLQKDALRAYLLYHYSPAPRGLAEQGAAVAAAAAGLPHCSLQQFVNSGLVGCLANVSFRVLSYVAKKLEGGRVPPRPQQGAPAAEAALAEAAARERDFDEVTALQRSLQFGGAMRVLLRAFRALESYLNAAAPWKLIRDDAPAAHAALWAGATVVISGARAGAPMLPEWSARVLACVRDAGAAGAALSAPEHLFQHMDAAPPLAVPLPGGGTLRFVKHPSAWPCVVAELSGLSVRTRSAEGDRWKERALAEAAAAVRSGRNREHIEAFRETPALRADPSLRHSVDNLEQLFAASGKLPGINVVVDIYNAISLRDGLVMGAYDCRAARGGVLHYGPARGDEHFVPLNYEEQPQCRPAAGYTAPVMAGEHLVRDDAGNVITTFCKQSVSSAVTQTTSHAFLMVWGNPRTPQELLRKAAADISAAVEELGGKGCAARVIYDG